MLIQLLIIQIVTFIGLILVLRMLFYRQLNSALARLKGLYQENLERQERLKKELKQVEFEKESKLAKAKEEARLLVQSAKEKSEGVSAGIQQRAKEEAQRTIDHAHQEIRQLESDLQHRSEERAIELSLQMLQLTFADQKKSDLQHQLLSEFMEELKNLDSKRIMNTAGKTRVITASELTPRERERFTEILSDKMGAKVTFDESVDPEMIAGLIIHIGDLTIDGSLKNQLHKASLYLRSKGSQP